jgi:hypothetical protein
MDTKHTPGAWKTYTANDGYAYTKVFDLPVIEISNEGQWIAYVRGDTKESAQANAALMAAAPELLKIAEELLERFLNISEHDRTADYHNFINQCKNVIKKATTI